MTQNTLKEKLEKIITLANECLQEVGGTPKKTSGSVASKDNLRKITKNPTGCIGSILELVNEGFFDTQKTVSSVVEKLKEEGQPYSRALVSMNLLNLVKPPRKILRRIKGDDDQWQYIVRK